MVKNQSNFQGSIALTDVISFVREDPEAFWTNTAQELRQQKVRIIIPKGNLDELQGIIDDTSNPERAALAAKVMNSVITHSKNKECEIIETVSDTRFVDRIFLDLAYKFAQGNNVMVITQDSALIGGICSLNNAKFLIHNSVKAVRLADDGTLS